MDVSKGPSQQLRLFSAYLLLLALLSLVVSFHPEWRVWGLDTLRVYPVAVRIGLLVLLAVVLIPGVSRRFAVMMMAGDGGKPRSGIIYALATLAFLSLCVLLSSNNHLLGDGYTLLENIRGGQSLSPTEPLAYLLSHFVYLILPDGFDGALWAYRLCSYLAAAGFLWVLYSGFEDKRLLAVGLPLALTFPVIQFFFGYVESYTFSFLFALYYLITAGRDLKLQRLSWPTVMLLLPTIGFHLSGVVLLPSLVYVIWNRFRTKRATIVALSSSGLIVLAGLYLATKGVQLSQVLVPLLPTSENPYSLFSAPHFIDLLNLLLLDYPLLPVLIAGLFLTRIANRWFYLLALTPALVYIVLVDPKISALRDWDLLSRASAPTIAIGLELIRHWWATDQRRTLSLALPLLLFAIIHSGSWIVANTGRIEMYGYIKNVVANDIHYSGRYYQGYRNKGWSTIVVAAYKDMTESIRAQKVRLAAAPADNMNRYNLAMHYFFHTDQYQDAVALLAGKWPEMIATADRTLNIAGLYRKVGDRKEEARVLGSFIERGGVNNLVYFNYARCLGYLDQIAEADVFYQKAFAVWPDAPVDARFEFCFFRLDYRSNDEAADCFSAIAPYLERRVSTVIEALIAALRARDQAAIESLRRDLTAVISENPAT